MLPQVGASLGNFLPGFSDPLCRLSAVKMPSKRSGWQRTLGTRAIPRPSAWPTQRMSQTNEPTFVCSGVCGLCSAPALSRQDCVWRNRDTFFQGREAIVKFLRQKWEKAVQQNCSTPAILSCCLQEQEYRLIKELFAFEGNRIGVCFQYEFKDASTGSDATCADHI